MTIVRLYLAISIILFSGACRSKANNKNSERTHVPIIKEKLADDTTSSDRVEIYCLCFEYKRPDKNGVKTRETSTCESYIAIDPRTLAGSANLHEIIYDKVKIQKLRDVIADKSSSEEKKYGIDSRFLILFRNKNAVPDTFVVGPPAPYYYYKGVYNYYSFDIMESISRILDKKEIICSTN